MKTKQLKLTIDLVPETCWYKNLRTLMPCSQWDKLRRKVYSDQGNACCICGANGKLNCHEVWEYNEEESIQKLMGFQAVCSMCHHVTHFGMSQILANQGHLDLNAVIYHFIKVNEVDLDAFKSHKSEAFQTWRERSKHQWKIDLGEWSSLIKTKQS